jgi:ATP-binding cassette subfamily C protein
MVWLAGLQMAAALTEGFGLVLMVPLLSRLSGGSAAATGDPGGMASLGLSGLLIVFAGLVIARAILVMARNRAALELEIAMVDGLRQRAWRALLQADWRYLSALKRSDQASLLISNLDRVGLGINQLLVALSALATLLALGLAALAIAPLLAAGAALTGGAVLLAYRGLRRAAARQGEALGAAWNAVHSGLGDGLAALRSAKSLGAEARLERHALSGFAALAAARRAFLRSSGYGQLALQAGGAVALAGLIWLGIDRWHLSVATILPLVALFVRAVPLLGTLQESWQNWLHARPALQGAQTLIADAEAAREPLADAALVPELQQSILVDGVTVRFGDQPVSALDGVSMEIAAGSVVAIAGPSGAGKSTLADLLAGLLLPDAGRITIDGTPLEGGAWRAWRSAVAYVEQEPLLLATTIRDNLAWGVAVEDEQLWAALEAAAVADFVRTLPDRLDTVLGDGGRRLSGGERQRLMLARALLRKPKLLILDEATSALDPGNEAAIVRALAGLRGLLTILIIAHRGALTGLADRIVRLDHGRVVDESVA